MIRQLLCQLGIALVMAAGSTWAASTPDSASAPEPVMGSVNTDASPDMQAERDDLAAQWEADARASGIDPDQEEVKPTPVVAK